MIRHQLPMVSPLGLGRLLGSGAQALASPKSSAPALEQYLRGRFGAERVVLVGSGTQALQLALTVALGADSAKGRPVALPAYTCYDVAAAAVGADARVVFYDIDPLSLAPDLLSIRRALAAGAGAVVVNNLYGFPVDWEVLRAECDAAGALLVEDAAQGLGSGWKGEAYGRFGDLTVLSFGRGKGWTGGSGGALLQHGSRMDTDRSGPSTQALGPAAGGLNAFVGSLAQWLLGRPSLYGIPMAFPSLGLGETHYHDPERPRGMGPFQAALVMGNADRAFAAVDFRRAHAARWRSLLGDGPTVRRCEPLGEGVCGYLRFPVVARRAEELLSAGVRHGVAQGYPKALHELDVLAPLMLGDRPRTPGALELSRRLLTFPTHALVREADFVALERVLEKTHVL